MLQNFLLKINKASVLLPWHNSIWLYPHLDLAVMMDTLFGLAMVPQHCGTSTSGSGCSDGHTKLLGLAMAPQHLATSTSGSCNSDGHTNLLDMPCNGTTTFGYIHIWIWLFWWTHKPIMPCNGTTAFCYIHIWIWLFWWTHKPIWPCNGTTALWYIHCWLW